MKKHLRFIGYICIFLCIAGICVRGYFAVITPKFLYDSKWPTTKTYVGFYEMERNSIDVLFLGSSHAASAFIPQEIYDQQGIRSYNLGCEMQNMVVSYYWLKEALRFQKPKVVVLDCYVLFDFDKSQSLNTAESGTRKALDYMRWSSVKTEAVHTICEEDKGQSEISYYLPNVRYHDRWKSLEPNDFKSYGKKSETKGFAPRPEIWRGTYYHTLSKMYTVNQEAPNELMKEYLDKICKLCEENQIQLILVKTPTPFETISRNETLHAYAEENELLFIDMNEHDIYEEIGFDAPEDLNDPAHCNIWGARKVSDYMGKVLKNIKGIEACQDEQWEDTREYYDKILETEPVYND